MMKIRVILLFSLTLLFFSACGDKNQVRQKIAPYHLVWDSPSESSRGSMPLSGAAGYGANVWVEDGALWFYLASANSFDENGNLLKLGAVKVEFSPNPLDSLAVFRQELDLYDGEIVIEAQNKEGLTTLINLWIDPVYYAVHIDAKTSEPVGMSASFATWRDHDAVDHHNNGDWIFSTKDEVTRADSVETMDGNLVWYHQNRVSTVLDTLLAQQRFEDYRNIIHDPTHNLIFGGMICGNNLKYAGSGKISATGWTGTRWTLESPRARRKHRLQIVPFVEQESDPDIWKSDLLALAKPVVWGRSSLRWAHLKRWREFWQRSYIVVNSDRGSEDPGFQIGRNYQLFRYMLATNRDGRFPLRFNGGVFTFDPMTEKDCKHLPSEHGFPRYVKTTPDYARWGNIHMGQNQRLIGWPSLAAGDFDLMEPSLRFYTDRLEVAEARSEFYWNHGGAAFVEHLNIFGLPSGHLATPNGDSEVGQVKFHYTMQLEFAYMALLRARYSGESISPYLPFVESAVRFFDEHYAAERQKRKGEPYDADGKLELYPANVLEVYSDATNPVDIVSALRAITGEVLSLPETQLPDSTKSYFEALSSRIPDVEYEMRNGKRVIRIAREYGPKINNAWEFAEMYTVFPYKIFGFDREEGYEEALNTWYNIPPGRENVTQFWSWMCTPIYAAGLGLTEEARRLIIEKMSDKNANVRFPAFFGPGHDWIPDMNWGGSGMTALQRMLLDTDAEGINLYPAWPADWDVEFRLHGYEGVVVESGLKDGRETCRRITPEKPVTNDLNKPANE